MEESIEAVQRMQDYISAQGQPPYPAGAGGDKGLYRANVHQVDRADKQKAEDEQFE